MEFTRLKKGLREIEKGLHELRHVIDRDDLKDIKEGICKHPSGSQRSL